VLIYGNRRCSLRGVLTVKLLSLHVKNYKCIDDSEKFSLDPVTCLVGKNEAGKTAVLEAIHKINPDLGEATYDVLQEYPRRRRADYQQALEGDGKADDVVIAEWELEPRDMSDIEEALGEGALRSSQVEMRKGYYNGARWMVDIDEKTVLAHFLAQSELDGADLQRYEALGSLEDVLSTIEGREGSPGESQLAEELISVFPDRSVKSKVEGMLTEHLPRFVYFDQYHQLPGRVRVDQVAARANEDRSNKERAFEALLGLVNQTPQSLLEIQSSERLFADLEAASAKISEMIFDYWSQNRHLDVEFELDQGKSQNPPPFNDGQVFEVRIRNHRHKVTINFDERSQGFVWFFSFLVWFWQAQRLHGEDLILLLDEPGLGLHAKAQQDLLRYVAEELEPKYQVIYTAHSPFMVDPHSLLSCRTVEDVVVDDNGRTKLLGTKVGDEVLSTDADTLSPLQGALGYDITQTLFVGKNSLLVEGPSDLLYLKWFSERLRENGRTGLDPTWTIVPVGGIGKILPFVSLFDANLLNVAVFVDFAHGQKGKVREIEKALFQDGHTFIAPDYVDGDEADTEDLLGRSLYFELVNRCYGLEGDDALDPSSTRSEKRVLLEVDKHLKMSLPADAPPVNHYQPALHLTENTGELVNELPDLDAALDRFEGLFRDVNSCLG